MIDVRVTLQADDGAVIFVQLNGGLDARQGFELPMAVYVAPLSETGEERYVRGLTGSRRSGRDLAPTPPLNRQPTDVAWVFDWPPSDPGHIHFPQLPGRPCP